MWNGLPVFCRFGTNVPTRSAVSPRAPRERGESARAPRAGTTGARGGPAADSRRARARGTTRRSRSGLLGPGEAPRGSSRRFPRSRRRSCRSGRGRGARRAIRGAGRLGGLDGLDRRPREEVGERPAAAVERGDEERYAGEARRSGGSRRSAGTRRRASASRRPRRGSAGRRAPCPASCPRRTARGRGGRGRRGRGTRASGTRAPEAGSAGRGGARRRRARPRRRARGSGGRRGRRRRAARRRPRAALRARPAGSGSGTSASAALDGLASGRRSARRQGRLAGGPAGRRLPDAAGAASRRDVRKELERLRRVRSPPGRLAARADARRAGRAAARPSSRPASGPEGEVLDEDAREQVVRALAGTCARSFRSRCASASRRPELRGLLDGGRWPSPCSPPAGLWIAGVEVGVDEVLLDVLVLRVALAELPEELDRALVVPLVVRLRRRSGGPSTCSRARCAAACAPRRPRGAP